MKTLILLPLLASSLAAQTPLPEWRLSATPVLRLGGEDATGPTEFANPYTATFLSDRLLVLDGQSQVLRAFRLADGQFMRTIGRKGHGPGEFQNAAFLQPLPGDSLFVADIQLNRYCLFDAMGYEVRTVSLGQVLPKSRLTPVGRLADGTIMAWAPRFDAISAAGIQSLTATIYRVAPDGTKADSVGTLPFAQVNSAPFQKGWGYRALLGAGQLTPAVSGEAAVFNSPTSFTLYRYAPGAPWRISMEVRPVRLGTGADGERLRAAAVAQGASASYMATVPVADTLPAIHYLVPAPSGRIYVVEGAPPEGNRRVVTVYSSSGQPLARLTVASTLRVLAATDTLLAVTERDPDTAPTIWVYRLLPP